MEDYKTSYDAAATDQYEDDHDHDHDRDRPGRPGDEKADVFGDEDGHAIKYKTLSWGLVAILMIAEIVSNGMLSLPYAIAAVGLGPGVAVIAFLGIWATFTSWLLVRFKLRHPGVHTMGDAGMILFGVVGREVLAAGTVIFAIFATGSQLLAGQLALGVLSDNKLCTMLYTGIFAAATLLCSFPRTLDRLAWLSVGSVAVILAAGIVGMVGAGLYPTPGRTTSATATTSFYNGFTSVTNPVFAYAGHFMFFILISEMRRPQDAMKAAWTLQIFATTFYIVFGVITYLYLGAAVASPSFLSLTSTWAKAAFGVALLNFLVAGALYSHTSAKLVFVRLFRNSRHVHANTVAGWGVWTALVVLMNGVAFLLAVGVPIFNQLVGLAASLFAAWYTYGIAGAFWLHDAYHDGGGSAGAWRRHVGMATLSFLTILGGAFICVAGCWANIKAIVDAYKAGTLPSPFTC